MVEQGVSNAYVALGVFEINWIDFMGHGRGASLALDLPLFEILNRDIAPDISIEIE